MIDYYDKLADMSDDALMAEIQTLHTKLLKINHQSKMTDQLRAMIDIASVEYNERMITRRYDNEKLSDVIEIGEIEEVVYTPNYSDNELVTLIVSHYSCDKISQRKKQKEEREDKLKKEMETARGVTVDSTTKGLLNELPTMSKGRGTKV